MSIVYQHDKRSGITYAYESESYWDPEKRQSRSRRRLIGRVDEETGEIVPTDGRMRRARERAQKSAVEPDLAAQVADLGAKVAELAERVSALERLVVERGDSPESPL